jgi:hypothetical protein
VAPPALLNGNDLIQAFNLSPGPEIGRLLEQIREAQASGEIKERAEALAYARARYTEGGDFDRSQRQMQVIMAIRKRVLKPSFFPTLLGRAPDLYNELASGIHTNMTFDEAVRYRLLLKSLENIMRHIISEMVLLRFS